MNDRITEFDKNGKNKSILDFIQTQMKMNYMQS